MNPIIEKAAMSIACRMLVFNDETEAYWASKPEHVRENYRDDVLAVLRAIREPNTGMIGAGCYVDEDCNDGNNAIGIWQAMIDHLIQGAETAL